VSADLITTSDPRILEGNIAPVNVLDGMPIDPIKLKKRGLIPRKSDRGEAQVGLGGWIRVGILILRSPTAPPSALSDAKH